MSNSILPVVVSVLITRGNSVLLGIRKNNTGAGMYSTPGGRLEQDETITECAIRETKEETGLVLDQASMRVLDFAELFRFGGHYIVFYIWVCPVHGEPKNLESNKCEGWEWIDLGHLPSQEDCTEPDRVMKRLQDAVRLFAGGYKIGMPCQSLRI